jgi:hypothetical protein
MSPYGLNDLSAYSQGEILADVVKEGLDTVAVT